ncbi:MAG: NAD-dependent epimerase/dehydratase family protein [Lachnospiraceae bacterium]|nr:NAD-dependent epimerase/dehydratase family protein [Lachnospiraceae bacterium]
MINTIIEQDLEDIYQRKIPWERLKHKTVLITGAYGMLASYVVYMLMYLNEKKDMDISVIALVRSRKKFEKRFGKLSNHPYLTVYENTLENPLEIAEQVDFIIHAASLASPQYYSVSPIEVLKPNVVGNYHLLELAVQKKVEGYLFFSTGDIYGAVKNRTTVRETDYGEMDTLDIHSCYGESKRMGETMCKAWFLQKRVPTKIARIWHTYAPTMDIERDPRVFASFVKDVMQGNDIVMKSDGRSKRSFCYISDAVVGYFLILLNGKAGEAYNVCNTEEFYSIREVAEIVAGLYPEKHLQVRYEKREEDDTYLENSQANDIPPSNEKLKALGWETEVNIREGFRRVIESLKVNQEKEF